MKKQFSFLSQFSLPLKFNYFMLIINLFFLLLVKFSFPDSLSLENNQKILEHKVTVTLKLIQVYVTDEKGNPVTDLEKSDFILYDNGKLMKITDFEKHILPLPTGKIEKEIAESEPVPSRKIPSRMNRKFLLLIDLSRNNMSGIVKSKKAALHFVETQLQTTDEVGVFSYSKHRGLILHEYFTSNHQKIIKAIKKIKGVPGENIGFQMSRRGGSSLFPLEDEVTKAYFERGHLVRSYNYKRETAAKEARDFSKDIKEFAKALRSIPGYKHIIFFSWGLSSSQIYDKYDSSVRGLYEDMCKELASASIAVYTVNTFPKGEIPKRGLGEEDSLKMLSELSGGRYFEDVNYYDTIAEDIQKITTNYYVLGYYIDEKWDGKYHEIKVKVNRKGCQVHAQGGYFNPKPFTEFSGLEKKLHLIDLALGNIPYFQEPVKFPLLTLPCSSKKESNLVLLSEIPLDEMKEVTKGDTEVITFILDKHNRIVDTVRIEVNFTKLPKKKIYYYTISSLPPGHYKCRAVIRNLKTGKAAVASSSVDIPDPLDSGLKLYPPLLLIPEKEAYYLKIKARKKGKAISIVNIFPFISNKHSPIVKEMDLGVSKLLAILRYTVVNIQKPKVKLFAYLVEPSSGSRVPLPFSVISSQKRKGTNIFLLEFKLPILVSGNYSLELVAEELNLKSKSLVVRTFKVR